MIEKYTYEFSAQNIPVERVKKDAVISFKTLDCFSNEIQTEKDLTTNFDNHHTNPASGPVYVEDAEPGDLLVIDILDIKVNDHGVITTLPGVGPLYNNVETRTRIIPIKNGQATFKDLEFPINPMIGVIGVAPKEGAIACGFPGSHGGNMDNHHIVTGSRVYLPVNVPGALLQLGDIHATMGDGEICGTGIEIAAEVSVKVGLIKNFPLEWPVLETNDKWYTIASAVEYPDALQKACLTMQKLIVDAYGWDTTDAYLYMSVQGDVEICQACKPCEVDLVVRFGVPKLPDKPLIKA